MRPTFDPALNVWTVRLHPWCPPRWFKTEQKALKWMLDKTSKETTLRVEKGRTP